MVKKRKRRLLIVCLLAAGCATPVVRYTPISGPDDQGLTKFQFAESVINFTFGKTSAGITNDEIVISSVPVPYGDKKYAIEGTSVWQNWGVATEVSASFRGDSDLIQQIDVSVTDQRQQAIQAVGSIAGFAGGLLSLAPTSSNVTLPKGISVTTFLSNIPIGCDAKEGRDGLISCHDVQLEGTKDFVADLSIGRRPDDALPASVMDRPFYSSSFFYSACRQMTIVLKPTTANGHVAISASVSVADPLYLETLRIPAKGSITVAPSCGANSKAQDPNLPTAIDYVNALATQAKAVKQSFEKTNSSGAGTANKSSP
jgi:hypothetical protein